jgi:hypothetical protein
VRREVDGKQMKLKLIFSINENHFHELIVTERQIQQQRSSENPPGYGISVYTIHGRRTLINYHSDMPPRSPAHLAMKEELPPTYEDALKFHQIQGADNPPTNTIIASNTQRRISV